MNDQDLANPCTFITMNENIWIGNSNALIIIVNGYSFMVYNSTTTHSHVVHAILDINNNNNNCNDTIEIIIHIII